MQLINSHGMKLRNYLPIPHHFFIASLQKDCTNFMFFSPSIVFSTLRFTLSVEHCRLHASVECTLSICLFFLLGFFWGVFPRQSAVSHGTAFSMVGQPALERPHHPGYKAIKSWKAGARDAKFQRPPVSANA